MSTDLLEPSAPVTTVHTHLRPIDRDADEVRIPMARRGGRHPHPRH